MITFFRPRLPKHVRQNLAELQRMESYFKLAAELAGANTAVLNPNGQEFATHLRRLATLIEQRKTEVVANALARMGIAKAQVNFETGRIKPMPHESADRPKAA